MVPPKEQQLFYAIKTLLRLKGHDPAIRWTKGLKDENSDALPFALVRRPD